MEDISAATLSDTTALELAWAVLNILLTDTPAIVIAKQVSTVNNIRCKRTPFLTISGVTSNSITAHNTACTYSPRILIKASIALINTKVL